MQALVVAKIIQSQLQMETCLYKRYVYIRSSEDLSVLIHKGNSQQEIGGIFCIGEDEKQKVRAIGIDGKKELPVSVSVTLSCVIYFRCRVLASDKHVSFPSSLLCKRLCIKQNIRHTPLKRHLHTQNMLKRDILIVNMLFLCAYFSARFSR